MADCDVYFIDPATIETSNISYSPAIAEDEWLIYDSAKTYDTPATAATSGNEHTVIYNHGIYECLADGAIGVLPDSDQTKWVRTGTTKFYSAFDDIVGTQTAVAEVVDVTLSGLPLANALALFNLDASELQITVTEGGATIYDETISLVSSPRSGWWSWVWGSVKHKENYSVIFPPTSGSIRIQIKKTGSTAKVGNIVFGTSQYVGKLLSGGSLNRQDYSSVETDDYGNTAIIKRKNVRTPSITALANTSDVDAIDQVLRDLSAKPIAFIGGGYYRSLSVYGLFRDTDIGIVSPPYTEININILEMI